MRYLNETENGLPWESRDCLNSEILEYSLEKEDYFLNFRMNWKEIEGDMYTFSIGDTKVSVPSGFYVLIGDVYGNLDWVMVDEAIGRPLDLVVLTKNLEAWSLSRFKLVDMVEDGVCYWPQTKNIIPLFEDDKVIVLSDKDCYSKTRNVLVNELTLI